MKPSKSKADDTNPKDRLGALKVPLRLNPGVPLIWMALVFELGAFKYGEYNWRNKKVRISVYSEAIDRHNLALRSGEDIDPESGLPHTAHIMACAAIIEDARACDSMIDDRFEKDMSAFVLNAMTADNYHKKVMGGTRTPARTLDEIRGGIVPFTEFMANVITGVKTRRATRDAERTALTINSASLAGLMRATPQSRRRALKKAMAGG